MNRLPAAQVLCALLAGAAAGCGERSGSGVVLPNDDARPNDAASDGGVANADGDGSTRVCGMPGEKKYLNRPADVSSLAGCTTFLGSLSLENTYLANLDGLETLRAVAGDMNLFRNFQLLDIHGLRSLATVGGRLVVNVEPSLETLDGLEAVRSVGALLTLNTMRLRSIQALSGLETVVGDLMIFGNVELPQADAVALAARVSVGGVVTVMENKP